MKKPEKMSEVNRYKGALPMSYGEAFKGLVFFTVLGFITIPFAIWKWIEIIVWLIKHLSWI